MKEKSVYNKGLIMEKKYIEFECNGRKVVITSGYHSTMFGIYVDGICFGGNVYVQLAEIKAKEICK